MPKSDGMRIYSNRADPRYISRLEECLDLKGTDGLRQTAVEIEKPFGTHEGNRIERCVAIDFFGMAATTLFDHDTFLSSSLVRTARSTVLSIHGWREELGSGHPLLSHPNRIDLRFSSIGPSACGMRINHRFFYDVYTLAKRKAESSRCLGDVSPVVELTERGTAYLAFCDHFRYMWEHDATIDASDAIGCVDGRVGFKSPYEITCHAKAERVCAGKAAANVEVLQRFENLSRRILARHCPPLRPAPATEVAFLACSWRRKGDRPTPNENAVRLHDLIGEYFGPHGTSDGHARLGVRLVAGMPGEGLTQMIYGALDDSTIGIVVLSPDIAIPDNPGKFLCRPNVYHELGYLMARLEKNRTFLFLENSVEPPSNVSDLVRIQYKDGVIELAIFDLLLGLLNVGVLAVAQVKTIAASHLESLRAQTSGASWNVDDLRSVERVYNTRIVNLKSATVS